jgi:hypothetical protein
MGKPVVCETTYVMASDDFEDLKGVSLMKSLGGVDVVLIDALSSEAVLFIPGTSE